MNLTLRLKTAFGVIIFACLLLCVTCSARALDIEIVPLGEVDSSVINHLHNSLVHLCGSSVKTHKELSIPTYSYDYLRAQYHSSAILESLSLRFRTSGTRKILAVIDEDLFSPEYTFVFGTADPAAGVAVISLTRLRQLFYGLNKNRDLFLERVVKEALHEIGHLLGLLHCPDPQCVMYFSNSIIDTDNKQAEFCERCRELL